MSQKSNSLAKYHEDNRRKYGIMPPRFDGMRGNLSIPVGYDGKFTNPKKRVKP
jgi:hypothetical protein